MKNKSAANAKINKMSNIILNRLSKAIENEENAIAKINIELLERLKKLINKDDLIPQKMTIQERKLERDKLMQELEERFDKLSKAVGKSNQ